MSTSDRDVQDPEWAAREVVRLREELARLQASQDSAGRGGRRGWWRPVVAGLLVALAAIGYLAQDHPTGGTALWFVLLPAAFLLVLEVLASSPEPVSAPPTQSSTADSPQIPSPRGSVEEPVEAMPGKST